MDKSITCECGNDAFWVFLDYVRCPNCYTEYRKLKNSRFANVVVYKREFNNEEHAYQDWKLISLEPLD